MSTLKRIFGWIIKALGTIVLLLIIAFAAANFFSQQEKELTRKFFDHLGQQNFEDAYALLHPRAKKETSMQAFQTNLENLAHYNDFSFMKFNFSSTDGVTLNGQASTETGCSSNFTIRFIKEQIVHFNVNPACFAEDRAA